jgi:carboxyl-terminal processing protease
MFQSLCGVKFSALFVASFCSVLVGCDFVGNGTPHPAYGKCDFDQTREQGDKEFVLCVLQDTYLWSDTVASLQSDDLQEYDSAYEVLAAFKNDELDRYSFIISDRGATDYFDNGIVSGDSGMRYYIIDAGAESYLWVYMSYIGSPAHKIGIRRGNRITSINGKRIGDMLTDVNVNGSSWSKEVFLDPENDTLVTFEDNKIELKSGNISIHGYSIKTVEGAKTMTLSNGDQGFYFAYHGFIAPSKEELAVEISQFDNDMTFAIVDLRRNGGGYTRLANLIASTLGGLEFRRFSNLNKKYAFKRDEFNQKYREYNMFQPFYRTSQLPKSLQSTDFKLKSITFLTDEGSCSASELLINAMKAFDHLIDIKVVGSASCGKPYGMYGKTFGENKLFAVELRSANAEGVGDYTQGIDIDCSADGAYSRSDWGDESDPVIAQALALLNGGGCFSDSARATSERTITNVIKPNMSPAHPYYGRWN